MKKSILFLIFTFLISCQSEPSLQKYFVENSENKDFISVDISPNILKVKPEKLTIEQSKAIESFEKMNILAFKKNDTNESLYETEKTKVSEILKDKKYQELMKFGSGKEGVAVYFIGTDEKVEEFVLYGKQATNGFALVRILGDDMNPSDLFSIISLLKESNIDMEQLKPLQNLIK